MGTTRPKGPSVRSSLDAILGTRSQVRLLRVLERMQEPMSVRELARRADERLQSAQRAVRRLIDAGLAKRVGTGSQQQVRWNPDHPLAPALHNLFRAERERYERVVSGLKVLIRREAHAAIAVWMCERSGNGGPWLEVGVLADSGDVDGFVDALRQAAVELMKSEAVWIEMKGWTLPDLEAAKLQPLTDYENVELLWGVLPPQLPAGPEAKSVSGRSHRNIDEDLRKRAERLTRVLQHRPELVRMAKEEIQRRLETAKPQEARTLREWLQVLEGMSHARLLQWLVDDGEHATRLRQSMPMVFLSEAAKDDSHS